ncbi:expressed unknown protein [Seminavis robusta]|uniref:Uncharacterized protein n=1 Tax=Seminavis robusta TaxID=568900 RepID=A0A9N8HRD5_9STRA|nr:expressed unknown protein [Seminavis robusta]|eukprot:Sro1307_g261350.1 n/a (259) ;mRNA; r:17784-18560
MPPLCPLRRNLMVVVGLLLMCQQWTTVDAFQAPLHRSKWSGSSSSIARPFLESPGPSPFQARVTSSTTQLSQYNLPPSGGGGGGKDDNVVTQVIQGGLTIGAIVLFFVSPLGGIFFAITNSLFLLALITPVILTIAFQVWQSLNTIEGTCPNCGAPKQRVVKDPAQPGLCFNCGSIIQASPDLQSIELSTVNSRGGGFVDMDQPGAGSPAGSIFDIFGAGGPQAPTTPQQPTTDEVKTKENKFRREQTIIDVEVNKDD